MRRSENYAFKLPERTPGSNDKAIIDDLTYNWKEVDTLLREGEKRAEALVKALASHKSATLLDHPNGSVTDAKIGNRKIHDNGGLQALFDSIGDEFKAIKGADTWRDAPAVNLLDAEQRISDTETAVASAEQKADNAHTLATDAQEAAGRAQQTVDTHMADTENPHTVTAAQVGAATPEDVDALLDGKVSKTGDAVRGDLLPEEGAGVRLGSEGQPFVSGFFENLFGTLQGTAQRAEGLGAAVLESDADLDNYVDGSAVTTNRLYYAQAGNGITHKPEDVDAFGSHSTSMVCTPASCWSRPTRASSTAAMTLEQGCGMSGKILAGEAHRIAIGVNRKSFLKESIW